MMISSRRIVLLLSVLLAANRCAAVRKLRIASPLQALTIWDPEVKEAASSSTTGSTTSPEVVPTPSTPRSRFLNRFKAGLSAEMSARKALADAETKQLRVDAVDAASTTAAGGNTKKSWAKQAAIAERKKLLAEEQLVEQAHDKAVAYFDNTAATSSMSNRKNPNQYQFVGVITPPQHQTSSSSSSKSVITWYARKKPENAKWSVRLVHANQDAIIKDLFQQGKVDVFAKYKNTGKVNPETNTPVIERTYSVKERSWKNLWNISPKHLFTDSSGMYWRERRLRPGLYTDGNMVYEATYRYRDGRNGMHRRSSFQQFLNSKAVDQATKQKILKNLKENTPDVVLEE